MRKGRRRQQKTAALVTRLELHLRRIDCGTEEFADLAAYSRQHLLRLRIGEAMPTRRAIVAITRVFKELGWADVTASTLFERGDELLNTAGQILKRLHIKDIRAVNQLLSEPITKDWPERVAASGIATETVTIHLLHAAAKRLDAAPAAASIIYTAAARMAATLRETPPELAASLRAYALKGRANAHRLLGAFDEAFSDLTEAAQLFATVDVCAPEAGQVEYARALTLFKRERWREAVDAVATARAHFVASDDIRRVAHADVLHAGILFDRGEFDAAREIWLKLRVTLAEIHDYDALARVWMNLGACEIRRGNKEAAGHWLSRAYGAFRTQGNQAERARTLWNIGAYFEKFRSRSRALRAFMRAQRSFEALGMWVDAGCVGLDITELMITMGADDATLTEHAQHTAAIFVRAGLAVSAAHALDQLKRVATHEDRRKVLEDVRAALHDTETCDPWNPPGTQEAGTGAQPPELSDD